MTVRLCSHCDFYEPTSTEFGECRRYAPREAGKGTGSDDLWPVVFEEYWCGEFKPFKLNTADVASQAGASG